MSPERIREYQREYRRKWRSKDPRRKQSDAEYRARTKRQRAESKARYYKKHKERIIEAQAPHNHRRRARKAGAEVGTEATINKWEKQWRKTRFSKCYWCAKRTPTSRCHLDHIVPLAKGGPHSIANLCVSCAKCNLSKSDKSPKAWNFQISSPVLLL